MIPNITSGRENLSWDHTERIHFFQQHVSFSNKIDKGLCIVICIIIARLRQTDRQRDTQLDGWSERGMAREMKYVGHVRKIQK